MIWYKLAHFKSILCFRHYSFPSFPVDLVFKRLKMWNINEIFEWKVVCCMSGACATKRNKIRLTCWLQMWTDILDCLGPSMVPQTECRLAKPRPPRNPHHEICVTVSNVKQFIDQNCSLKKKKKLCNKIYKNVIT